MKGYKEVLMPRKSLKLWVGGLALLGALFTVIWISWSETEPEHERAIRLGLRSLLEEWFPEAMTAPAGVYGLFDQKEDSGAYRVQIVLVHGLDEPGGIWDELIPALSELEVGLWEFRYPNDQAIDLSADLLAEVWSTVPAESEAVLIGHSMGGLVSRDFVSRRRHPVEAVPDVEGAPVKAVFMVGTPNHGSEWARLRVWLELRDQFESLSKKEWSLFSALQDGLGTAKVDLRPRSGFLNTLNARPWPEAVDRRLIGGVAMDHEHFETSLQWLQERSSDREARESLDAWWSETKKHLGDGVVTLESLSLEGAPAPLVFPATHRGLLRNTVIDAGAPPAIAPLVAWIEAMLAPLQTGEE